MIEGADCLLSPPALRCTKQRPPRLFFLRPTKWEHNLQLLGTLGIGVGGGLQPGWVVIVDSPVASQRYNLMAALWAVVAATAQSLPSAAGPTALRPLRYGISFTLSPLFAFPKTCSTVRLGQSRTQILALPSDPPLAGHRARRIYWVPDRVLPAAAAKLLARVGNDRWDSSTVMRYDPKVHQI